MSDQENHLADWQREAVNAAQNGQLPAHPNPDVIQPAPNPVLGTQPTTPSVNEAVYPAGLPQNLTSRPPTPVSSGFAIPLMTQAEPKQKNHTLRNIFVIMGMLLLIIGVLFISLALKPKSHNVATTQTKPSGREIPTDCYQFTVPYTYEFDLSTPGCTFSGGDGVQHQLLGIQPVKSEKTDETQLKNLSQFTLNSFIKSYPNLKQTQQSTTQFAGKTAFMTTATDATQQLTIYFVTPDKPYTVKNDSYSLILVSYLAPVTQTDGLKSFENTWHWK